MSQLKYDIAEILVNDKDELLEYISPSIKDTALIWEWYEFHGLGEVYRSALAGLVAYRLTGAIVDSTSRSFEEVSSVVDVNLVCDLYGEKVLTVEYWRKK